MVSKTFTVGTAMLVLAISLGSLGLVEAVNVRTSQCVCPANECGFGAPPENWYTCPNGNILDNCGCVTSCQCDGCPFVDIAVSCPNGRKKDSNGCPLNECQGVMPQEPCICPANECGFFLPADKNYTCPRGNIVDKCGCVTSCQCAGCPPFQELMSCPFGRKTTANGCPLNECNSPPIVKAGRCPRYGGANSKRQCKSDKDCPSRQKCCSTRYSNSTVCRRPVNLRLHR